MRIIRWSVLGAMAVLFSACSGTDDTDVTYTSGSDITLEQTDGGKGSTEGGNAITVSVGYATSLTLHVSWQRVDFTIRELQVRTTPACDADTALRYRPRSPLTADIGTGKSTLSFIWKPGNGSPCAIGFVPDSATSLHLSGTDDTGRSLIVDLPLPATVVLPTQVATVFTASPRQRWFLSFDGSEPLPAAILAQATETDGAFRFDTTHNAALLDAVRADLLARLVLYRDDNGNGTLDATDTLIARGLGSEDSDSDDSDHSDVSDGSDVSDTSDVSDSSDDSDSETILLNCLHLSPTSLDFGSVEVGARSTRTLQVRNRCENTVNVSLSFPDPLPNSLSDPLSDVSSFYLYLASATLKPAATHAFEIDFAPIVPTGPMAASLLVTASLDGDMPLPENRTIPLSGVSYSTNVASIYLASSVQNIFGSIDVDLNFVRYRDNGTFRAYSAYANSASSAEHTPLAPKSCTVALDCPTGRCENGLCATDCTDGASDGCLHPDYFECMDNLCSAMACVNSACEWTLPTDCDSDSDCEGHGYCTKLHTKDGANDLCRSFCSAGNPERYSDTCYFGYPTPIWNGHLLGCTDTAIGPTFNHDDTTGSGTERLSWVQPQPGRYRVVMNSYSQTISKTDFNETKVSLTVDLADAREFKLTHRVLTQDTIWKAADIVVGADLSVTIKPLCAGYTATPCTQTSDCASTYGAGFTCEQNTFGGQKYCNMGGAQGGSPEEVHPTDPCTSDADCPDAKGCGPIYEQVCACLGGDSREELTTNPYANPFYMGDQGATANHYLPMDPLDTAAPRSIWCDSPSDTVDGRRTCADLYASAVPGSLAACHVTSETPHEFGVAFLYTTKTDSLLLMPSCGYPIKSVVTTFTGSSQAFTAEAVSRPSSTSDNDPLFVPVTFHAGTTDCVTEEALFTVTFTDGTNTVTRTTRSTLSALGEVNNGPGAPMISCGPGYPRCPDGMTCPTPTETIGMPFCQ